MDLSIIEEKSISVAEVSAELKKIKKADKKPLQQQAYDTTQKFARLSNSDSSKITKELNELGIARLTDDHVAQIANFLPRNLTSKGIITKPTVVQAIMNAVTARRLTPLLKSSPPVIYAVIGIPKAMLPVTAPIIGSKK